MKDYTFLYRKELPLTGKWTNKWDLFISGYNNNERVRYVFDRVDAAQKFWILHDEYGYSAPDLPPEKKFYCAAPDEAEYVLQLYEKEIAQFDLKRVRICIDITGIMRPHLMFLIKFLSEKGVRCLDVIYSEPYYYSNKEDTKFSDSSVSMVRQVIGFEGVVENDTSKDLIIIGAGYESHLIAEIAEDKDKARKAVLLGFPSLRADMYQQNAWRAGLAADALGESLAGRYFAPANDPFVTASVLSEIFEKENRNSGVTNLYLSPISTKAQALGFAIFYLGECKNISASIIYPFSSRYSQETSTGISRVWCYTIEFPI